MGLMRTPPSKSPTKSLDNLLNSIAPSPSPTQEQQQEQQQELPQYIPKRTISQELDPFKKKPKLIRSPPNQQQQQQQPKPHQQPSSIPVFTRQPKTPKPRITHTQPITSSSSHQAQPPSHHHTLPPATQDHPPAEKEEEEQEEEEEEEQEAQHEQEERQKEDEQHEEEEEEQEQKEQEQKHHEEDDNDVEPPPDHDVLPTHQTRNHNTSNLPSRSIPQISTIASPQKRAEPPSSHSSTLPPQHIEPPIFTHKNRPSPHPTELVAPPPKSKQTSRRKSRHSETDKRPLQPVEQQAPPKLTRPVVATQPSTHQPTSELKAFTSRKSFMTEYDTSRESNATSLTPNLQFMEHKIEELEELVKLLEGERALSELTREVEESQRAWDREWDGSREKEFDRVKLEERLLSIESSSKDREVEVQLKSLELKNLDNQLSIKDHQCWELVERINEYQRQNVSWSQGLVAELEQLRITNAEWAQIGQNFESLIEIERREKEELQGRYELELRQSQLEPNFEINALKYQLVKAENRAERLAEQLRELADQSKTFQAQLISETALKDKLKRELELSECRVKSLADQITDLNNSLSQLHKGEESTQRTLLQDLLAARSALAEKEQEIINLNARLSIPSQPSVTQPPPPTLQPTAKRGRKKAEPRKKSAEEEEEEAAYKDEADRVNDPDRQITSDSWVSIGAVAKKLHRKRLSKGANSSPSDSSTRDLGIIGPSSKNGAIADEEALRPNDANQPPKKRNPKLGKAKQSTLTSKENAESNDHNVTENDRPVVSPEPELIQSPKKKNAKESQSKATIHTSKEKVQPVVSNEDDDGPEIEAEDETVEPPEEAPEQPTNTRAKKRVGKGKAKQLSPDEEEVGSLDPPDQPRVETNVEQQPAKNSRPVRGKATKKTAKANVAKNNKNDDDDENDDREPVVAKRGAQKLTAVQVGVPRGRRKQGRGAEQIQAVKVVAEKDPADESDLIVTTNEEDGEGAEEHGDSAILAIAEQDDNDDEDDEQQAEAAMGEEEDDEREAAESQAVLKRKKPAGPGRKKAPPARSRSPSASIPTPPSPSPASGKKKTGNNNSGNNVLDQDRVARSDQNQKTQAAPRRNKKFVEKTDGQEEKNNKKKITTKKAAVGKKARAGKDKDEDESGPDAPREPSHSRNDSDLDGKKKGRKRKSSLSNPDKASSRNESGPGHENRENHNNDDRLEDEEQGTVLEETLNKKKRKIFHSKKPTLAWPNNRDDENNMLGLPPELSPIKMPATKSGSNPSGLKRSSSKIGNILPMSLLK